MTANAATERRGYSAEGERCGRARVAADTRSAMAQGRLRRDRIQTGAATERRGYSADPFFAQLRRCRQDQKGAQARFVCVRRVDALSTRRGKNAPE